MKVKNLNGTSKNKCKCPGWLEHWRNFGGKMPHSRCAEQSCQNGQEVGAHVQIAEGTDSTWYIVPLCTAHNAMTGQSLDLVPGTTLVPANVTETCGKVDKPKK